MDDTICYLVVLLGEDEELYGLAVTVQYHVENVIAYDHLHETENDLVHVMEQEERGTDDEEIAKQKDTSDRYILIFIDYRTDNIRTSGTTVRQEIRIRLHLPDREADRPPSVHLPKYRPRGIW